MSRVAVALLSGGLDSMLAIRLLQQQDWHIEALSFRTQFACCQDQAAEAAADLGVRLTVLGPEDAYLDVIRRPRFGYGRGANPCVDCRIYMFRRAADLLQQLGGELVISGEVVGQRPMSQKKRDLARIAFHAGLEDRLLRPLSAKLLPPTTAEVSGQIDRQRLCDFSGRSRKPQLELAQALGLRRIPSPSNGCALTEPSIAAKVFDLLQLTPDNQRWDFDLLSIGRHVRIDQQTKVVVGRREEENRALVQMFRRDDSSASALLEPDNFLGPTALVCGPLTDTVLEAVGGLLLRSTRAAACRGPQVRLDTPGQPTQLRQIQAVIPGTESAAPSLVVL